MNSSISESILDKAFGWILIAIATVTIYYYANGAWSYFLDICPNTDVLTWDENIRLNTVYDQYSNLKNGKIWKGIHPFLESPTWPPLRPMITLLLVVFAKDSLVTEWDSFLGLAFLLGSFLSLTWISYQLTKRWLYTGIILLSSTAILLQTIEVSAYSLSSMLETQSMFFLLWCYYFLHMLYESAENPSKRVLIGVSFALLAFFFTKYPYGLMLFLSIIGIEVARNPKSTMGTIQFAFTSHYKGIRRILLLVVVLLVLSLPFLRLISDVNLNQRSFKLFLYYISLPVFLDFQYFLWKYRVKLREICPKSLRVIYILGFLPSLVWIYSNPDRVSSLVDAQMIVNHYTKSFFLSLVAHPSADSMLPMAVFDNPWGIRILIAIATVSIGIWLYPRIHSYIGTQLTILERFSKIIQDPLATVTLILFLQILILETTTGNKQQRHILQFLPGLAVVLWIWVLRGLHYPPLYKTSIHRVFQRSWEGMIGLGFFATIMIFSGSTGLWSGNYFQDRHFCLRGEDKTVFEPARWIADQLPKDKNILLFNGFHDSFNYDKTGRVIASEIDLKIRQDRFRTQIIRHDDRHKIQSWEEFQELALISYSCNDPNLLTKLDKRKKDVGAKLSSIKKYQHKSGEYCVERYRIE